MTEEKMNEVIRSEGENSLLMEAIMQLLRQRSQEELECALNGEQTDSYRAFNNGRAAAIIDIIGLIEEKRS